MQNESEFEGQEEADRVFRANSSLRCRKLSALESWVQGRQYDGMPPFWSDGEPLWDRAPCIVYPIVAIAIDSYVDLLLGQSRFPEFTSKPGEDSSDEEDGLSPDDSKNLDRFLAAWHKASRFRTAARETLFDGMATGSAALVFGVRDSAPFNDLIPAKWCDPKLSATGAVQRLEIRYAYQEQYRKPNNGKWAVRTKLYRRVIDEQRDVEYLPAEANEQGTEPQWRENPERSVTHGFGFCPVVWYPFMRGCVAVNVVDGKALHADVTDEIRAHDIARSQWHRGALMSEPQIYEVGVSPGYNPTEVGVTPRVLTTERGGQPSPNNPVTGAFVEHIGGQKSARKRGPSYVWQYPNEAKVGAIFYPGEALKAQEDNARDIKIKLMEMLGVVLVDPESLRTVHQLSGKTLEALRQKQIDRCDKIRDDLEERFFGPAIAMQLRIARAVFAKKGQLRVPGAKKAAAILAKNDDVAGEWYPPSFQLKWGDYFHADPQEQALLVNLVVAALGSKVPVLTVRVAVEKLAPIFGIDNVAGFIEELEKEAAKRSQSQAINGAAGALDVNDPEQTQQPLQSEEE